MNYYQQALSLYNQGDYEGAFDLLAGDTSQDSLLLKAECEKQITEQYIYFIKEAIEYKDYVKARHLKDTYLSKFGSDTTAINAFQIPDKALCDAFNEKEDRSYRTQTSENLIGNAYKKANYTYLYVILGCICVLLLSYFFLDIVHYKKDNHEIMTGATLQDSGVYLSYLAQIESDKQKTFITINSDGSDIYYLKKKDGFYLPSIFLYNVNIGEEKEIQLMIENEEGYVTSMLADIQSVTAEDNSIVLIGSNGGGSTSYACEVLKYDLASGKLTSILTASEIKRTNNIYTATQYELVSEGEFTADHKFEKYIELYDLKGNLIDGKTIRGKGAIGKYPIEMSFHVLAGNITGWYKYEGHTNYMTIQGKIDDTKAFDFVEFNEDEEAFGRFVGDADFEKQTLTGTWKKDNSFLDFYINRE